MKCLILLFAIFCICRPSTAYTAAVFEHYPQTEDTPLNTILKNLNEYREFANKAKSQSADIAVFPEYGLTTLVDDPDEYATEINDNETVIKKCKAIAKERNMYLVVNLLEKEKQANKATKYYNTNLVFDRNGDIITKYRKINLFNEGKLTPGPIVQNNTFTTDFGVTFATFTSFDILFEYPSKSVLENKDVTDIAYPTAWFATMPFFTALSVQHGYAVANGVNLLAANYDKPTNSHGGSGIYLADGSLREMYIADTPSSKPIIQNVTKIEERVNKTTCYSIIPRGLPGEQGKSNVSNYKTDLEFKASDYKFENIDLSQKETKTTVCDSDFCCTFEITVSDQTYKSDVYKVMAYDGPVSYGHVNAHLRVCSLVACESDSKDSCGKRVDVNTTFTKIKVEGNLLTDSEDPIYYTPVTLNSYLQPLIPTTYCNSGNGTKTTYVQLSTTKAQQNVLVFGILGSTSAGTSVYVFSVLFLIFFSFIKFLIV